MAARLAVDSSKLAVHATTTIYYAVNEPKTWDAALKSCQVLGSDLVTIMTYEEQKSLMDYLKRAFPTTDGYWVGANGGQVNEWAWTTGEPLPDKATFLWNSRQNKHQKTKGCLTLHPQVGTTYAKISEAGFCPHPCADKKAYICEKKN